MNKTSKKQDLEQKARMQYSVPLLKEFGAVGALTQSGSGANQEGNMGAMPPNMFP